MKPNLFTWLMICIVFGFLSCKNERGNNTAETNAVPELKSIFINGDSLHYIDIGKGEPVVFVHGTLGDYRVWGMQLDTFGRHHRVIAYSRRYAFPNRQEFNDSADYSVNIHTDDLVEFLKALNTGPVHLVGHSYGAYIALMTTLRQPDLVKSLMLGEPPVMPLLMNVPGGDSIMNHFLTNSLFPAAEAFKTGNNEKAVSIFVGGVLGDTSAFSSIPPEGREIMLTNTLELRGATMPQNQFPPVTCDELKKIKTPVMLMLGEKSPALFSGIINELEKCLLNNKKFILPNASHGLEFDNPAEFNKSVLEFISNH